MCIRDRYTTHTHNSFIEIAGGVGLIGMIFYAIYLIRMLYKLIRNVRAPYSVGVIGALAAAFVNSNAISCLLYTSDAADDLLCVDLGGRRIIKKKKNTTHSVSYTHILQQTSPVLYYRHPPQFIA